MAQSRFISPSERSFSHAERSHVASLYGAILVLHVSGWWLYLHYSLAYPSIVGLGFVAYLLGLRHAFDADHLAAIDDTVRLMLQKGGKPLSAGFFFSLGHSSVVLALVAGVATAATAVKHELPQLKALGEVLGAGVSGLFLWVVGILNLMVLFDLLKLWRTARGSAHSHAHLDELLQRRGVFNRLVGRRFRQTMTHGWQMYPLGLLFGLGFDTASEVGLLAMTAAAAVTNLPVPALLCLPVLFAAGMTLIDTTDGILMVKAYHWALVNPLRKVFYNLSVTGLSIALALIVGTIELLQVAIRVFGLKGGVGDIIMGLDLSKLGYAVVGLFLVAWGLSVTLWKLRGLDRRDATYDFQQVDTVPPRPIGTHPYSARAR